MVRRLSAGGRRIRTSSTRAPCKGAAAHLGKAIELADRLLRGARAVFDDLVDEAELLRLGRRQELVAFDRGLASGVIRSCASGKEIRGLCTSSTGAVDRCWRARAQSSPGDLATPSDTGKFASVVAARDRLPRGHAYIQSRDHSGASRVSPRREWIRPPSQVVLPVQPLLSSCQPSGVSCADHIGGLMPSFSTPHSPDEAAILSAVTMIEG